MSKLPCRHQCHHSSAQMVTLAEALFPRLCLRQCSCQLCTRMASFAASAHCVSASLQVKLLRNQFRQALGEDNARHVDINTIDGFQVA